MDFSKTNVTISLKELKSLISEWVDDLNEKITVTGAYDSYERMYEIFSGTEPNIAIYRKLFHIDELISENSQVSTSGIMDDEFRQLIVQCRLLDKQLAESKKKALEEKQKS